MIRGVPSENVTVCSVGVFGNNYIRDVAAVTIVEIPAGETHIVQIEHVRAEYAQGNDLAINLR